MCCVTDRRAQVEFLASLGRRKTFIGWKVVGPRGRAEYANYRYSPGVHRAEVKRYDVRHPTGIHVYLSVPISIRYRVVAVVCRVDDIVRIGRPCHAPAQCVMRRIQITKKAWREAGLPNVRKDGARP